MDESEADLSQEILRLYDGLESLPYWEFLAVRPDCDYLGVRDAFYARAQRFHPDRFVAGHGPSIQKAAYAVYKRMTEAYTVLSDPLLRHRYDAALAQGQVRLPAEQRMPRLGAEERNIRHPLARSYLRSARAKLERGDARGAWIDVELGASLEPATSLLELRDTIEQRAAPGGPPESQS